MTTCSALLEGVKLGMFSSLFAKSQPPRFTIKTWWVLAIETGSVWSQSVSVA